MGKITTPSGYTTTQDFFAATSLQDSLRMITLKLPWRRLVGLVVVPDPDKKSDYNRPLTVAHAKRFGQYVDLTDDPFTPPITLFTDPEYVELESLDDIDPLLTEYGFVVAKLDRDAQVFVLDGQHRIYGIMLQIEEYETKLDRTRQTVVRAKKNGDPTELILQKEAEVKDWRAKLKRLDRMEVTVQVILTGEGDQAKRIFADVADNAKGISGSQRADFSDRSVFNRVAREVSLTQLVGLVDHVNDRMSSKNPHWISLKDVVNVAQALEYPIGKRWTVKRESELIHRELAIEGSTRSYFEGLFDAFPDLAAVREGTLPAPELRSGGSKISLLGSASMIRAMASAYRRLRAGDREAEDTKKWKSKPMKHAEIIEVWSKKLPNMEGGNIPDPSGDPEKATPLLDQRWLNIGVFDYPYLAPKARNADLNKLAEAVTKWTHEA